MDYEQHGMRSFHQLQVYSRKSVKHNAEKRMSSEFQCHNHFWRSFTEYAISRFPSFCVKLDRLPTICLLLHNIF